MRSGIGGLLAQSGANIGSQVGGAYGQLGSDIGGMLSGIGAKRQQKKQTREVQELLAKYQNNPAQLNAVSAKYASEGNDALAKVFAQAAQRSVDKKAAQVSALEQSGQQATEQAQLSRALQVAGQRKDQEALVALRAKALSPADYLSGLATSKKPQQPQYNFSEETILVDGKPTRVQVATNKVDPTDKRITTIGEAPEKEGAESPKTLTQRLQEAGVTDVDLTTLEGAKQARRDIIKTTGNASLANSVGNIIEDLTPLSIKEGLDIVRSTNPEFVEAENLRELTTRFNTLEELSQQDIAGLSALIERTLTATTENDIKAVAELERFRKAKDLPQRLKDFALEVTTGKLSKETIDEYSTLAAAFEELATLRMSRALDSLILNGSEKEADAAKRARDMILGESKARIIN